MKNLPVWHQLPHLPITNEPVWVRWQIQTAPHTIDDRVELARYTAAGWALVEPRRRLDSAAVIEWSRMVVPGFVAWRHLDQRRQAAGTRDAASPDASSTAPVS